MTTENRAASAYNASDGAAYEIFLGRWSRRLAEALVDFARFPETGDLLDAGCGTGSFASAMATRWPGRRVIGIDIAEPYIDFAQQTAAAAGPRFDRGDLCRLPYAEAAFSGAGSQLVLNFVNDADLAVREMRRVTRRDGVVAAAIWDFRGGLVYQRLFWDTAASIDPKAGAVRDRLFSAPLAMPDGLMRLFASNGLIEPERGSLTIRMDYADFDDYWQPLLGGQGPVGTYAASLSPDLRRRIEDAVRAAYLAGATDGPRSMTATAWAVRAAVP
jgi:SAM-dependent methyltransferase